ncbi:MAG: bifunctional folylpolyglutamate synthase/dihydrofolate synthase [Flavobacterium sp.]|nr:bifunctional folylpolyglutamate synthase/dihydrofolate synthase [Pedobacter sp.]
MDYQQTIQYLYSRLPMFSKIGKDAIKPGLNNIIRFCDILGNPHHKFRSVHIAGTNGKGSTSHMLAAILQVAGYKTGLYTSPHLRDFRERIRVNGEMINKNGVVHFVKSHKEQIEQIEPSFFETTVAMAFDHFAKEKIDIVVVEVGLGGRLDSTNLITPLLSVITNISLDHTNILGNNLQMIASEKAGIIKPGVPVIVGEKQKEVENLFITRALENKSSIIFASNEWEIEHQEPSVKREISEPNVILKLLPVNITAKSSDSQIFKTSDQLFLDLTGSYQLKNLATVLSAVNGLISQGFVITEQHIKTALRQVSYLTGLMGRWQTISLNPLIICDTGHNEEGIKAVLSNIAGTPYKKLHMVIGMVKDKDIRKILLLLPKEASYYFCQPDIPRAKNAEELYSEANENQLTGKVFSSVKLALAAAKETAQDDDLIFVGGSTFVVAEIV